MRRDTSAGPMRQRAFIPALTLVWVALLLFAASASAMEPWEEKLAADGWSRVDDPKVYRDTTWYLDPWVVYVPPDGRTIIWRNTLSGAQLTATKVSGKDGRVCRKGPLTGGKVRCQVLWRRGNEVRGVTDDGRALTIWTVRPGNTENLKP